jgi:hypothetical protein
VVSKLNTHDASIAEAASAALKARMFINQSPDTRST